MSKRYKGNLISASPLDGPSGIWSMTEVYTQSRAGKWPPPAPGQQAYTTAGTYSWVAPASITSVSVVAVGGGGGATRVGSGGGGELRYTNNITVVPGNSYSVVVGAGGSGSTLYDNLDATSGGASSFNSTSCVANGGRGSYTSPGNPNAGPGGSGGTGDGGGNGGSGASNRVQVVAAQAGILAQVAQERVL